jgi:splicing factor 1
MWKPTTRQITRTNDVQLGQRRRFDPAPMEDAPAQLAQRSQWGEAKTEIPAFPTAISTAGVSQAQLDNYAIQLHLEEISGELRLKDFVPPLPFINSGAKISIGGKAE